MEISLLVINQKEIKAETRRHWVPLLIAAEFMMPKWPPAAEGATRMWYKRTVENYPESSDPCYTGEELENIMLFKN